MSSLEPHPSDPARRPRDGRARNRTVHRRTGRATGWCGALPTSTGWWLLALAVALGVAGYALGTRVAGAGLLTDAAILLGSVLVVALLSAWVLAARTGPTGTLPGPDEVPAGRAVSWTLPLRAPGDAPIDLTWRAGGTARAAAPAGLRTPALDGAAALVLDLHDRGLLRIEARRLSLTEPLGLARGHRALRGVTETVVLPRPLTVPGEVLGALVSRERGDGALQSSRTRGGGESGDLRPYRPGDPLASIHWRQSARTDSLLVTEREDEESPSAVIALDTDPDSYRAASAARAQDGTPRTADPRSTDGGDHHGAARDRERAIRLAAALLTELAAAGRRAELLIDGLPAEESPRGGGQDGADRGSARRALALLPRADEDAAETRAPAPTAPAGRVLGAAPLTHRAVGDLSADAPETVDLLITGAAGPAPDSGGLGADLLVRVQDGALRLDEGSRP